MVAKAAQEHLLRRGEPTGGVEDHVGRWSVACLDGLDRAHQHLPRSFAARANTPSVLVTVARTAWLPTAAVSGRDTE